MSIKSKSRRDAKKKKAIKRQNSLQSNNKNPTKQHSSSSEFVMMRNPLSNLTDEQRRKFISELGNGSKDKFIETLNSLDEILRAYDPITLITILSGYGLTIGVSNDGPLSREPTGKISQADVELMQALALQIPEEEIGRLPVTPDVVQTASEKLIELSSAFRFSRMNENLMDSSESDMAINLVQEMIRGHTQVVRNWGFNSQIITISKEIYSFFDEQILSNLGFSASHAIDVFKALIDLVENRLSQRLQTLSELKSVKKPYDMLIKYHELIGQGKEEADHFAENYDLRKVSHDNLFLMLLSHYDLRMPENFLVDVDEISDQLNLDKDIINNVLNHFSYASGDLNGENREFFFLDNPVWTKPIISSDRGYYCSLPQLFFSFILQSMDEITEGFDKDALHKRRADYLEAKIENIVKERFPESQVVTGIEWNFNGVQYETDLIVFIDSFAVIIEAKSHKISKPALRGAPDRIKRHFTEILIDPGIQSHRLEQKLNELKSQDSPKDSLLTKLPVNINQINKVIRVSVSLEDFAMLQSNLRLFDNTGWIPNDFVPCPSMNLADFETLFDFLEHPVQIIHYLLKRTELEGNYRLIGDELDFMGLYNSNLLNVEGMVSDKQTEIIISGMSDPLDKYYISKDQGILINKPQPNISPLFKEIFFKLEERATPRWTEIGCILNRFPPDDQSELVRHIQDLSKVVDRRWQVEEHKNIIVYCPPNASEYALSIVLFKDGNQDRRYEFIEHASKLGLEPEHVKYCLVIAINIDRRDIPYHYISLVEG
ncbi:hypothetical protein QCB44_06325 [Thiomicrorhabdus sp. zzn3]|uniref:hypothetical protein n=1 Tax=Thiomicrorhabdus sp. zzn3 TaxID=3039775 RepID=UPI002437133A|nr:hypothetical protein [Thiomicrorhabdus sp. zzn3]MDG6778314.1 hypothetical protein [Thiomicrorhabdus sp. zzn3]